MEGGSRADPRKLTINDRELKGKLAKFTRRPRYLSRDWRVKPRGQDRTQACPGKLSPAPSGWPTVTIAKLHRSNDRNSSSWNACTLSRGGGGRSPWPSLMHDVDAWRGYRRRFHGCRVHCRWLSYGGRWTITVGDEFMAMEFTRGWKSKLRVVMDLGGYW